MVRLRATPGATRLIRHRIATLLTPETPAVDRGVGLRQKALCESQRGDYCRSAID